MTSPALADCALNAFARLFDERSDLFGRLAGPLGQFADLVGHHGKAEAVLAGPGRLDGGVEGQQIGLAGNLTDH